VNNPPPDWDELGRRLAEASKQFAEGMKDISQTAAFQGAAGWVFRGDLERARGALAVLTPEGLRAGSLAAAALAALCDEMLTGFGEGG
jgi:hypothetical protein